MPTTPWEMNLQNRPAQKLKTCLKKESQRVIYQCPCDLGVIRNGGKRGAKHGPSALLAPFLVLNAPHNEDFDFSTATFKAPSPKPEDFEVVQKEECQFFESELKRDLSGNRLIHLGGGHDHVYPFARALALKHSSLMVINIDAHLDTRPDQDPHSGTPFRQLYNEFAGKIHLLQVGIHNFANGKENYDKMGSMEVLKEFSKEEILKWITSVKLAENIEDTPLLLSVDCDGLDASYMPAVSAPNHRGLSQRQFHEVLEACHTYWKESSAPRALGLYEFNPLFDNLSQQSARYLASYMYEFFTLK
jgi:formiminoglutamase